MFDKIKRIEGKINTAKQKNPFFTTNLQRRGVKG